MNSDKRTELANDRLRKLINSGRDQYYDGSIERGVWTKADFDEIEHLSEILKNALPKKFLNVVQEGWEYSSGDQKQLAERLDRVWRLHDEFPTEHVSSNDALLPTFELSENDKAKVLELCSKMRLIILASHFFDDAHKRRLLDRINAIEKHVHQEKGLVDVVLGGVSDVGDTLKKFGQDLKPLTDRMAEIKRIVQSNSAEYSQIPAPEEVEALPPPEEEQA